MHKREAWKVLYEEERKMKIVEYLQENSRASVQELGKKFMVSDSTVRRDLKELEEARLLKRTHGGAVAADNVNFEPAFIEKEDKFCKEKKSIARKAVEFVEDGDTLVIDAGTTTAYLAKELRGRHNLKVVTNSLILAQELQGADNVEVILTGGTLRQRTLSLVGPIAEQALSSLRVDKAIIATNGVDIDGGLTTPNVIEAAVKAKMIEIAQKVILVADYSKVNKVAFAKFADMTQVDVFVVDDKIPQETVEKLNHMGVSVSIVTA